MNGSTLAPNLTAAMARLRTLDGVLVSAGVQAIGQASPVDDDAANLVEIAVTNEFGSDDGRIPARPWLRTSFDRYRKDWQELAKRAPVDLLAGRNPDNSIRLLGVKMAGDVKDTLEVGPWTPNAPMTIREKGSDQPLVDTGRLLQSQRAVVEIPGHDPMLVG